MKHDVHLYVTVRVKMEDIEAPNQQEAIKLAEAAFYKDCYRLTPLGEYADEVTSALVDEHGDEDYENSRLYVLGPDGSWTWGQEIRWPADQPKEG